jgi:histidinol-phosphate aminotransferase
MQRRSFIQAGVSLGILGTGSTRLLAREPRGRRAPLPDSTIRLSSNENPLGIAPEARDAIVAGIPDANRYPQLRSELTQTLAGRLGVRSENIVLGAGSTEVLKIAVEGFAGRGGTLVTASPTYEDAGWYAGADDLRVEQVPLGGGWAHDVSAMRDRVAAIDGPVCVYLCNPNNPTGTLTPSDEIDDWITSAAANVHFLVDEAYIDFVDHPSYHSALPLIERYPNVVVARTFSKVYGMAGIRLGYGIAHVKTAAKLRRRQVRNNANHFALVAGLASLGADAFVEQSIAVNERGRRIAYACFDQLGLDYLPSHTNFVMHRIGGPLRSHITRMREEGIRVGRPFPPMLDYNRVSIGLPEEMERFADTLRGFRTKGWI